jgi:hypothetical protein
MSSSESQSFTASYDSTTKVISAVMCAMVAVAGIATQSVIVAGLAALLVMLAYAYSPGGYAVSPRSIIVRRVIGDVDISLDGIREARAATADDFRGCIRLFGNGGLFGYYGLFRTSKLGKSSWYVTNRGKTVVVVTESKTAVLSPDNVEGFLAAIRASAPVAVTSPGAPLIKSTRSYGPGRMIGALIGATAGIAAIAAVTFAILYSPGPPSYTLTADSLTIHDRFYPVTVIPSLVDIDYMRIVDFAVDTEWMPTARTNGFANGHYHSGWYRVASGQKVRLYRADGTRLVLLPGRGGGTTVILEAKDPDAFMDEVRREWSNRS